MADSDKKKRADEGEEAEAEDPIRVVESGSPKDPIVRSLEEEFGEAGGSEEDKVAKSYFVREVEESLAKNQGGHEDEQNQKSPHVSDEKAGESSEAAKSQVVTSEERETCDADEYTKATQTQPFVAATAGSRASWANCCGLLDFLKRSDQ